MINFNKIEYKRVNFEEIKSKVEILCEQLKKAQTSTEFLKIFKDINLIHLEIEQYADYADICNMRDDENEFYETEMDFWNEYKPRFDLLFHEVFKLCINTPFKEKIKSVIPINFFNTIEYQERTSSEKILDLKKKENELKSQYRKLMSKKLKWQGGEYNLAYISSFFASSDRAKRKEAHDTYNNFFIENKEELDYIFDKMIKIRNEMALKLGFENYSKMSIFNLRRFGYDYEHIGKFRNNIKKHIMPLVKEIREFQKAELGLNELEYYDTIFYKENPQLLYTGENLLIKMKEVFNQTNKHLGLFYTEMLENNYIDLLNRNHKTNFAITNYLTLTAIPVITGNFKNKHTDVTTLTHEFGHAFQKHIASIEDKKYLVSPLLKYPTFDIAEMFSYAMQLITSEYVGELFSPKDYNKFLFLSISDLINSMPYIAAIDEFQEQIYSKKNITIEDVRKIWLQICDTYELKTNKSGHPNLEAGGYFYRQNHLFLNPFYYIDYAISYFGAFAIWQKGTECLDIFKQMAAVASYYPLNELVQLFNISNPFDEESTKQLAIFLKNKLNEYKEK